MRFVSLFSGMGGFDLGLERAGMRCSLQAEQNADCLRVLEHHWPNVKRKADVRKVTKRDGRAVDLVCGGFPCQDLSVAGKRAGLDGERSGLWWEFARVIECVRPVWVLVENVPGLFSSAGGGDFALIVSRLVKLGYGVAWRVLDSQYFGVAQRRRRVFIVGCLGNWTYPGKVLFEPESCDGDSPPSREAGKDVARCLANGTGSSGFRFDPNGETYVANGEAVASPITAGYAKGPGVNDGKKGSPQNLILAATLRGREHSPGVNMPGRGGEDDQNLICATLNSGGDNGGFRTEPGEHLVAFQCHGSNVGPMGTLRAGNGNEGGGVPFIAHSLRAEGHDASEDGTGRGTPLVCFQQNQRNELRTMDVAGALAAEPGMKQQNYLAGVGVRRLTPTECLRLQAFPDNWLDLTPRLSDSAKYRMCGNAVTVTVIEWIGQRMMQLKTPRKRRP